MLRNISKQIVQLITNSRFLGMVAFGCVFFTFAGPFGSFSGLSLGMRLSFWIPVFASAFLINAATQIAVTNIFAKRSLVQRRFISFFAFSGVFSPIIYTFINMGPITWGGADVSFVILSSWVFLTAGTSTALFALINPEQVMIAFNEGAPTNKILPPRLFRRLDLRDMQVSITRLTVNDHYVLAGISDGSEQRLLMRLTDAIAEMDDVRGFITHRSHWVSQMHIKGLVVEGKREMLELTTGVRVPISRTYRPVLVAAGVIPAAKESAESQLTP
jgi:hypothetical protein